MSHMVIYRSPDGKAAFQQVDDLASAVAFVEKIRNESGVENGRIYRLEQVNYRFEPYFQVRLDAGEASRAPATPPPPPPAPEPAPAPGAHMASAVSGVGTAAVVGSQSSASTSTAVSDVNREHSGGEDGGDGNGVRRGLFGR